MTEEEDPDLELLGTPPGVIAFFMILITLIVPLGVIPSNVFMLLFGGMMMGAIPNYTIYSILWVIVPGVPIQLTFNPLFMMANIWFTIPLTIFNIAYIWKMIRYYRGKCTRYSVFWVGLLSITIPTVLALVLTGFVSPSGGYAMIGPIPIQFIVGLIFLYKYPGPEMTSPWRYDLHERKWWVPKRPDWWARMFPDKKEDDENELEPESETEWLESE